MKHKAERTEISLPISTGQKFSQIGKGLFMKTVLVTGGAGFVGSHACKALARAGYNPIAFDNLERGHRWAVKWGPFENADLRSEKDLKRVFEKWKPWAVIHFAAYAYIGESVENPAKYYDNNVGGTAKLLAACAEFECKNIRILKLVCDLWNSSEFAAERG